MPLKPPEGCQQGVRARHVNKYGPRHQVLSAESGSLCTVSELPFRASCNNADLAHSRTAAYTFNIYLRSEVSTYHDTKRPATSRVPLFD